MWSNKCPVYYKNIEGVMLVFDMCDTNSFEGNIILEE